MVDTKYMTNVGQLIFGSSTSQWLLEEPAISKIYEIFKAMENLGFNLHSFSPLNANSTEQTVTEEEENEKRLGKFCSRVSPHFWHCQ